MCQSIAVIVALSFAGNVALAEPNSREPAAAFDALREHMGAMLTEPYAKYLSTQEDDYTSVAPGSSCEVTSARILDEDSAVVIVTARYDLQYDLEFSDDRSVPHKIMFLVHLHYFDGEWSAGSFDCDWDREKYAYGNELVIDFMDAINQ